MKTLLLTGLAIVTLTSFSGCVSVHRDEPATTTTTTTTHETHAPAETTVQRTTVY